jgi:RecA-family ATPase
VSSLYGDGGTGKTLLGQQLMTSTVCGVPWCGLTVEQRPALGVFCEDALDELHHRQSDINAVVGCSMWQLDKMQVISRVGDDNLLMTFDREGVGAVTAFFDQLLEAAQRMRAGLILIDTAADTFGGNENARPQVRQFLSAGLGRIAVAMGATIVLCAHPSVSGMASGNGAGGSTGWSNSVRSRLYLDREAVEQGEAAADENVRILSRKKANYAARGDLIRLRWVSGAFVPDEPDGSGLLASIGRRTAEDAFLRILDRLQVENINASAKKNAGNYAPTLFAKQPERDSYSKRDFERAMYRLIEQKRVKVEPYGRPGDFRERIVRAA